MNSIFQFIVCLMLIVCRTVLLPSIPILNPFYDIVIVYVVFAGLTRPLIQGCCLVVIAGGLMDSLSGGGFGVFLITYLWLFAVVRGLTGFMHASSFILLTIVLLSGVLLENVIQLSIIYLRRGEVLNSDFLLTVLGELTWVFLTGHILFIALEKTNGWWDRISGRWSEKIRDQKK